MEDDAGEASAALRDVHGRVQGGIVLDGGGTATEYRHKDAFAVQVYDDYAAWDRRIRTDQAPTHGKFEQVNEQSAAVSFGFITGLKSLGASNKNYFYQSCARLTSPFSITIASSTGTIPILMRYFDYSFWCYTCILVSRSPRIDHLICKLP